ncbi:lineage-specific thermal regulator protein [uncultured Roseburia sp.]|uniref:PadR family transcriptional regulator n=1 Tax=Brotonthovivens ammoniilytica TaxID=2981725 RepID=A0ABT2THK1_9FIRM|nr:PadR family transcriptional regulator [Brotonthovivens ammoniilytica]MCU6761680.1 PadR family transcriptional regulator [Brotonthovivens ammoniilytica]SCI43370.1 lineage-specific thermal regulator protein [uncultured Roseburia sp.]
MNNKNNFKKGSVELLVLCILQEGDCYGYQLTQMIDERSKGLLKIPEGSLYPSLYRLMDKGFISDEKRLVGKRMTRVYYHLEPEGLKYYQQLLEDYNEVHQGIQRILHFQPAKNSTEQTP